MKRITSIGFVLLAVVAAFSLLAGANTLNQKISDPPLGYEAITFNLYQGGGCGCVPIYDASVIAVGRTTLHNTSGITDDDGQCILELEYDETYRIQIVADGYQTVMFDFNILDEQMFSFHLEETNDSVSMHRSLMQSIFQRWSWVKRFIALR